MISRMALKLFIIVVCILFFLKKPPPGRRHLKHSNKNYMQIRLPGICLSLTPYDRIVQFSQIDLRTFGLCAQVMIVALDTSLTQSVLCLCTCFKR